MSPSIKRPTIEGMPSPAARAGANSDSAAAPAFDLDVKRSVQRHPKLAAVVAAVVLALVVAFGLSRTKMYEAESLTYIEPMASKVLTQSATQDGYDSVRYDTYIQQQTQTALRPDILATAIGKLPPFVWQHPGESMQSAVGRLQSSLKVERVSTSYQLSITLSDPNPETAASVVNAVTNTYLEQGRKDEHAEIDQRLTLLQEERQRIQQNLNEDRVEQASLGSALGVANPTGLVGNQYDAQIAGVQTQVATAREARDAAAAQLESLQGPGGTFSPALAAAAEEVINSDTGLSSLKGTISERKAVLNTQMAGMTPANPAYQQDKVEIADLDRSLETATTQLREKVERRLQDKMRADLERTAGLENKLNGELKRQTATATHAAPKLQRATDLTADIERLTTRYGFVDDAMRGLQLESNGPGLAHLSVAAVVPVSPEPSKSKLILLLALPLALISGAGAAVMKHRYDPRIYAPPDVEKVLGFLPIGVMPARAEVSEKVMEEYTLRLAAGLQSAYRTSSARSFVFTAASSTVEIEKFVRAIERVLGTLGFKAVALDAASVLNPGSRTPSTQRGLTMHRSSALVRTIDGVRQGFAAEEIDRLKSKYDLVLIDAPPLLNSAETEYLVRCTDATILIAESGVTVKTELYQSAVLLQHLNVAGVGAVLQELHLNDADDAFRAAIAAVERMHRSRSGSAGQISAGTTGADESAPEEETADESAERPQEMSVPAKRQGAKVDVAPAVRAAGMAPDEAEEFGTEETPEKPSPPAMAVEPERSTRAVAEQDSERGTLAGELGQEAGELHIEERDQVRPWRELLRIRKEIAAEPVAAESMEVRVNGEEAAGEPEPVLYFEDRLRPRKTEAAAAAAAPLATTQEQIRTEPVRVDAANSDANAVVWAVEPAVARAHEPLVSEPAQARWPEEDWVNPPLGPAASVFAERSTLESGLEAHLREAAERRSFETAMHGTADGQKPEAEARIVEPRFVRVASRLEEFEDQPELEVSKAHSEEQQQVVATAVPDSAGVVDAPVVESVSAEPEAEAMVPEALHPVASSASVAPEADASAVPPIAAPRRAPAAPKMEWFTLKFRGTSERVLRLVPGEEMPEGIEAEQGVADHSSSFAAADNEPKVSDEAVQPAPESIVSGEFESRADAEDVAQDALEAETEPQVEASVSGESQPPMEAEKVDEFEPEMMEANEPTAAIDEPLEPPFEFDVAESSIESEGGEPVIASDAREARFAEEAPIAPAAGPVPRAKINRWVVQDHAPTDSVWKSAPVKSAPVQAHASHLSAEDHDERMGTPAAESEDARTPAPAARERYAIDPAERLSTVRLMGELRSRSRGETQFGTPQVLTRSWSRRSAAAPVEERLEPRAAGLTRRWEMLSRFDSTTRQDETAAGAERQVSAAVEPGGL